MSRLTVVIVSAVMVIGVVFIFSSDSLAQVKKGKSRPLTTKQWMAAVHKVHCGALKKALDAGPKDDAAWEAVSMHAAMLNESSYVLMADGRCPDGTWAKAASKMLRGGSDGVVKAAAAKDLDAAKASFKTLTQSCGTCHKAHKPKK